MQELLINVAGTIVGGIILTFILFLFNEFVFAKINLTGEWNATITVNKTSYKPFENLVVEYKIHLIQKGYELSGSGEKISNATSDGKSTVFLRENRVIIGVDGYFERNYIAKNRIYLNISEEGRVRETRSTYFLEFDSHNILRGTFISTAADAKGKIQMTKS